MVRISVVGICPTCFGNLIPNMRGKKYCPECEVDNAIKSFIKNNGKEKNDKKKYAQQDETKGY